MKIPELEEALKRSLAETDWRKLVETVVSKKEREAFINGMVAHAEALKSVLDGAEDTIRHLSRQYETHAN